MFWILPLPSIALELKKSSFCLTLSDGIEKDSSFSLKDTLFKKKKFKRTFKLFVQFKRTFYLNLEGKK